MPSAATETCIWPHPTSVSPSRGRTVLAAYRRLRANETKFLLAAFIFEDVGVTAYKGAAPLIDNKQYLEAAAGILAVEAYHAGTIRSTLYRPGLFQQTRAISNLRDEADGDRDLDQPIGNPNRANIVPADMNGIAFSRTPEQVLSIVYLGGEKKGGFFPNGANL